MLAKIGEPVDRTQPARMFAKIKNHAHLLRAVPYAMRIARVVTARKLMSVGAVCHAESELTPGLQFSSGIERGPDVIPER